MTQVVSKRTIEREACEAARAGLSIDEACPYPFGSDQANHFKAVYLLALECLPTITIPEDSQ
jgi:hypothetical protein